MSSEMNWREYYPKFGEIEIEIGFGNSCTLLYLAKIHNDKLFVGIEIINYYYDKVKAKNKFENLIFLNADIKKEIIKIPSYSISKYYVYFPSPGPVGARIFSETFHNEILRTLQKYGVIKIVTDDYNYYEEIVALFSKNNWTHTSWQKLPFIEINSELITGTECETKYGSKFYLECFKK